MVCRSKGTSFIVICTLCLFYLIILLKHREQLHAKLSRIWKTYSPQCAPESHYDQNDTCFIKFVRKNLLLPPSGLQYIPPPETTEKISTKAAVDEKVEFIKKYFIKPDSTPGFFIECGANDGKFLSPTLKLELEYNWTGILIEADPTPFQKLVALHRNAWMMNVALCLTTHSDISTFYTRPNKDSVGGGLTKPRANYNIIDIPCVPLYTILTALEVTTVDYFSLDVEGVELDILSTLPFDKVLFKILMVEHTRVPGFQPAVIQFLESRQYKFIGTLLGYGMQDSVFVHTSVYKSEMKLKLMYDHSKPRKPR